MFFFSFMKSYYLKKKLFTLNILLVTNSCNTLLNFNYLLAINTFINNSNNTILNDTFLF